MNNCKAIHNGPKESSTANIGGGVADTQQLTYDATEYRNNYPILHSLHFTPMSCIYPYTKHIQQRAPYPVGHGLGQHT